MSYPDIDNDLDFAAALRGAKSTDFLLRTLGRAARAIERAAKADPDLEPALEDFAAGLHDILSDLLAVLDARDAAIEAYEHDCAGVEWAPEMMRGNQAGRTL